MGQLHKILLEALNKGLELNNMSMQEASVKAGYHKAAIHKIKSKQVLGNLQTWEDIFEVLNIQIGYRIVDNEET